MARTITSEFGPARLGASLAGDGVHFAVYSENAERISVCLFEDAEWRETQRLPLPGRRGNVHFGFIPGLREWARYGFRAEGPYDPAAGHRFDPSKLLVDPYARAIDRPFAFVPELTAPPQRDLDTSAFVPRCLVRHPETDARPLPFAAPGFTYEVLVRAFSRLHPDIPAHLRGTVAALAEPHLLDHLHRIGIETVELMPLAAWLDERHLGPLGLRNAWGYNPITHMAPEPRLAPGGLAEIRRVVEALHARGIRVLLDVVLNHSGEGPAEGPTICYRGLDNHLYYSHAEGRPDLLANFTGTGNTLAAHKDPVARLFVDTLRHWVDTTGIDGFRYDLAPVLGRAPETFDRDAPFFRMIERDPVLKDRIHVAEPWDLGPGGYQVGHFPRSFFEWQDKFRDDVRRFWKGEPDMTGALATRLAGSADLFRHDGRRPSASVNFIAAHDGFTLADLTAYERKHNQANGENNRDGHNENHSWNHGVEGPSADPAIAHARSRDVRALLAVLLVARGTTMIVAGDEFGRTQGGNNNAYAQDNEITWLDWEAADQDLIDYVGRLARLRRAHPALSADAFLTGEPVPGSDLPDVVWLREDGTTMREADWHAPSRRFLGMAVAAPASNDATGLERAVIYVNGGSSDVPVHAPEARPRHFFVVHLRSDAPVLEPLRLEDADPLVVRARSVCILVEQPEG